MTADELLERVYGVTRDYPCTHGHFDCAEYEGGPCANETYARLAAEPVVRAALRGYLKDKGQVKA
jgi:hypothetical protein